MFSGVIRGACVNNYIEGANDVGIYVNGTGTYQGSEVCGNKIKSCVVTGIALKRETIGVLVDNNSIVDCPNGISYEDFGVGNGGHPSNITITNNQTHNTSNAAFVLNRLTNSIVSNNKLSGVNSTGISITGGVNSVIASNTVVGGGSETTASSAIFSASRVDPVDSSVTVPDNLTVTGNVVSGYLGKGIYFQNGTNITITGNNIKVGNEGLRLNSGVTGVLIQQNYVDGTPDTSLYSGSTYIQKNNNYSGTLSSGYVQISAGQPLPNSGSSTLTAQYIGQEALHLAGPTWWKAYGTALTEWIQVG
jgi:parallel beta-helix repeat protein